MKIEIHRTSREEIESPVDVETVADLLSLVRKHEAKIIVGLDGDRPTLEVYDDYRE